MKKMVGLAVLSIMLISCAPIVYNTYYEGGHDPLFNINNARTIGFIPCCWTSAKKNKGYDELVEKQMFVYARDELQKRGFIVTFIPAEYIEQDQINENTFYIKKEYYREMPDLTLMLYYWQGPGNKVQIPGQGVGVINWGNYGGGGYYGQTQGYEVQTYALVLGYTLWSGAPKYMNKVWEGRAIQGSPVLDLFEWAPLMAKEIFARKFDR